MNPTCAVEVCPTPAMHQAEDMYQKMIKLSLQLKTEQITGSQCVCAAVEVNAKRECSTPIGVCQAREVTNF